MPSCPHCSESIEKLPGFVAQSVLEERLKSQRDAKDAEIRALGTELTSVRAQAQGHDAIVAERDRLRGELEGVRTAAERTAALEGAGLSPSLRESVELLYNSAVAGAEEPPAFGDWLEEHGKAHPLLAPHFQGKAAGQGQGEGAGQGQGEGAGQGAGAGAPPRTNGNPREQFLAPPGPGGKLSPMDARRYFDSAEFKALPRDQKQAKLSEWRAMASGTVAP